MLVASRYILDNSRRVPQAGHMVMGRFLSREFISELGERTRIDLDVWSIDGEDAPASVRTALVEPGAERLLAIPAAKEGRLDVFTLLPDLSGAPALILRAGLPRDIALRAEAVNDVTFRFLLVQGAILALMMMVPLNRAILAPLGTLSSHLRGIRRTNDLSIRVGTQTHDEIGELGREFDRMLSQLEEQIRERRRSEEKLRRSDELLREAQSIARVGSFALEAATGELWWSDELFRIHDLDPAGPTPSLEEFKE
jgi:methyl-accepting chemotaxis protein